MSECFTYNEINIFISLLFKIVIMKSCLIMIICHDCIGPCVLVFIKVFCEDCFHFSKQKNNKPNPKVNTISIELSNNRKPCI